nr:unnamed protein product [Spirometra erinaceieuropaei]
MLTNPKCDIPWDARSPSYLLGSHRAPDLALLCSIAYAARSVEMSKHNHEEWSCQYEYIEIYDGPSRSSPFLRKLSVCGGKFIADEGHIAVPRYPNNQLPNSECTWTIEVPVGFHIALTREIFGMTEHPQCLHDYLEVFDGPSESSPSLYKLCGYNFPPTIWSTNNTMTLRFVVNSSIEGQVFEANYRKQAACGGYLKEDQGNFTSPGYPITYPPNVRCVWKIEVPAEFSIVLTFENIELTMITVCDGMAVAQCDLSSIVPDRHAAPAAATAAAVDGTSFTHPKV